MESINVPGHCTPGSRGVLRERASLSYSPDFVYLGHL